MRKRARMTIKTWSDYAKEAKPPSNYLNYRIEFINNSGNVETWSAYAPDSKSFISDFVGLKGDRIKNIFKAFIIRRIDGLYNQDLLEIKPLMELYRFKVAHGGE